MLTGGCKGSQSEVSASLEPVAVAFTAEDPGRLEELVGADAAAALATYGAEFTAAADGSELVFSPRQSAEGDPAFEVRVAADPASIDGTALVADLERGLRAAHTELVLQAAASVLPQLEAAEAPADGSDGDAPWHETANHSFSLSEESGVTFEADMRRASIPIIGTDDQDSSARIAVHLWLQRGIGRAHWVPAAGRWVSEFAIARTAFIQDRLAEGDGRADQSAVALRPGVEVTGSIDAYDNRFSPAGTAMGAGSS